MSELIYAEPLFTFGSVIVYELKPNVYDIFKKPLYYWRYKDSSTHAGPFNSIMECTRDWEASTRGVPMHETAPVIDMSNVIKVDFRSRKRIT